jgi:hypothetical protein
MAAPAVPTGSPIEALFRSSTRFLELRRLPESWTEVELLPGLTIENIWATGVTWKDFCLFLRDKIVWIRVDYTRRIRLSSVFGWNRICPLSWKW